MVQSYTLQWIQANVMAITGICRLWSRCSILQTNKASSESEIVQRFVNILVVVNVVRISAIWKRERRQSLVMAHPGTIGRCGSLLALHRQHEPYHVILTDATVTLVTECQQAMMVVSQTQRQHQQHEPLGRPVVRRHLSSTHCQYRMTDCIHQWPVGA